MLTKLLEQNHRQQVGAGPAPGDHMERRRRLADLLAIPAAELFPYGFDHLPAARDHFQSARYVFAQLAQPYTAAAVAARRRIDHHAFARQAFAEGVAFGTLAGEARQR